MVFTFAQIVAAAQAASVAIPAAVRLVRAIGCAISDCPSDDELEKLEPADLPSGDEGRHLMSQLSKKAAGFKV